MLKANPDDDLTEAQETLFATLKTLLDAAGKVNKAARQQFIGAAPASPQGNLGIVPQPPDVPPQGFVQQGGAAPPAFAGPVARPQ